MDYTLTETLKHFKTSPTELNKSNTKKIKEQFPVPREQKILWADIDFGRRISGMVLTDTGIFIKGGKDAIKLANEKVKRKRSLLFIITSNGNFSLPMILSCTEPAAGPFYSSLEILC